MYKSPERGIFISKLQYGYTALREAAANNHFECVKYLVECGADYKIIDSVLNIV